MDKRRGSGAVTKTVGNASEAIVMARLVELGYGVSLPFGDNLRYDLVVDDGNTLTRVQVKTGRLQNGAVLFPARSTNSRTGETRGYGGEADYFLVYCPGNQVIYKVPVDECSAAANVSLRVEPTSPGGRGRPTLRWARDYEMTGRLVLNVSPLSSCATMHPDKPPRIRSTSKRRYCMECNLAWCRQGRARRAAAASS